MRAAVACLLMAVAPTTGWSVEPVQAVQLQAPLITRIQARSAPPAAAAIAVTTLVMVPDDAPADLGIGAFLTDRHGRWFQAMSPAPLTPGTHEVRLVLGGDVVPSAEPVGAEWDASRMPLVAHYGLVLWSASHARCRLLIEALAAAAASSADAAPPTAHLGELSLDGYDPAAGVARVSTGERWELRCAPVPCPANPYDPAQFALDALITGPDGRAVRIPAFYDQPTRLCDRGDTEVGEPDGPARFVVRYRPSTPGSYRIRLEARWGTGARAVHALAVPDLVASGPHLDQVARVDPTDGRFWSVDGQFLWPIGLNLHNLYDLRSQQRLGTTLTPARGAHAYATLLERAAAGGVSAAEIWLASWNLGLEWRGDWPEFEGAGRYNQVSAARLDAILDAAWAHGIRINLVIYNHGMASPRMDSEWQDSPYNTRLGGPLQDPLELFTSAAAQRGQDSLRRYLIARYADHPAILGWKLWSEINLTAAGSMGGRMGPGPPAVDRHGALVEWHRRNAAAWAAEDAYGHGISTHWSSDYRIAQQDIATLPHIDYLCIDAYLQRRGDASLADLLFESMNDPVLGLARVGKPILVTEYGGSPQAARPAELQVEMACAPWVAFTSGLAASPMLWWSEWVDQNDQWKAYGAIRRFAAGEDLRGPDSHAEVLRTTPSDDALLATAWIRPGRALVYVVDRGWAGGASTAGAHVGAAIDLGATIPAGMVTVECWDADTGTLRARWNQFHPGGELLMALPPFQRHLALKVMRSP